MTLVGKLPGLALALALAFLLGCDDSSPEAVRISGQVFGTGWTLTYLPYPDGPKPPAVQAVVEEAFALVNTSMSTYDPASGISQFNALSAEEPMVMDWDFTYVFNEAARITELSDGAYDVTVAPLVDLWGFGPEGPRVVPGPEQVAALLASVGDGALTWDASTRTLVKHHSDTAIDLSSIAKGYAVDLGADALDDLGFEHFMLEVGGEIQTRGASPRGDLWRIAIERPVGGRGEVQAAIALTDTGVATSGDYRNFFELDGQRYSHLIDPRSGYPIAHDLVSVTVIHPSTALADAWATALSIMGSERGLELAEERQLAVYLVRRQGDDLTEAWSSAFAPYLATVNPAR